MQDNLSSCTRSKIRKSLPNLAPPVQDRILRLPDVMAITGLSRASVYRMVGEGRLPQSVPLGKRSVGWLASEINAWLQSLKAEAREVQA